MEQKGKTQHRPKRTSRQLSEEFGAWDCPLCTYKNKVEAFKCSICDTRKGTSTRGAKLNTELIEQAKSIHKEAERRQDDSQEETDSTRSDSVSPPPPPSKRVSDRITSHDRKGVETREFRERKLDKRKPIYREQDSEGDDESEDELPEDEESHGVNDVVDRVETKVDVVKKVEPAPVIKDSAALKPAKKQKLDSSKAASKKGKEPVRKIYPKGKKRDDAKKIGQSIPITVGDLTVWITDYPQPPPVTATEPQRDLEKTAQQRIVHAVNTT